MSRLPGLLKGYYDREAADGPKPERIGPSDGRNEPCPCGSGKKYKKCCEN
ncbi:hypothetical protein FZC84_14175 [Rossellomorea vietnamensis]|uniref:Uncharacterized protein n=1 Tax=Rossellomorea vietnamensis TaxID=218284 RepID=A0A5D4MAX7_9BACI|nr:hypothetical protein FZC84_14175 [Rossellomorea vietnamensis]